MAIGGHESPKMNTDVWLTPPELLRALGPFDLDPCAPADRPWPTAANHISLPQDGLAEEWWGRVWLNPPYGRETTKWLKKLADHGRGTALIFARTETQSFFDNVWRRAHSVLFLRGRLCFHLPDGSRAKAGAGAPSCLVAYHWLDSKALAESELDGMLFPLDLARNPSCPGYRRHDLGS